MNASLYPGTLVAICGLDGAGKSTQVARLASTLARTRPVYATKQPTQWFISQPVIQRFQDLAGGEGEADIAELALLSASDRLRHQREDIVPHLESGKLVISDRHIVATFTSFMASGFDDVEWLRTINRYSVIPDLVVYLDIEPNVAIGRVKARGDSKKQEVDFDLVSRTRNLYLSRPWGDDLIPNYQVLDGTMEADEIERRIIELIDQVETAKSLAKSVTASRLQRGDREKSGRLTG